MNVFWAPPGPGGLPLPDWAIHGRRRRDLPPANGGTVLGRVAGPPNEFEHASVHALRVDGEERPQELGRPRVTAIAADGTFRFDRMPAGRWSVSVSRHLRTGGHRVVVEVEELETVDAGELEGVPIGLSIRGRLLDVQGWPVPGMSVSADPATGFRSGTATTDMDGRFEIRDLEAGMEYTLDAGSDLGRIEAAAMYAGGDPVTLEFIRNGTLWGHMLGPWGERTPIGGTVRIRQSGSSGVRVTPQAGFPGPYFERSLPPGDYLVTAYCGDFVTPEAVPVTVTTGETAQPVVLSLVEQGLVRVRVIDEDGRPQDGARLRRPREWPRGSHREETNDKGTTVLSHVPPGRWTLEALGRGRGEATFSVASGETVEVVIRLLPH